MLNTLTRCKPLLGTFIDVQLSGNKADDELITVSNNVFSEIERIHHLMSFHDPLSELSLLNQAMLKSCKLSHKLSPDFTQVLTLALELFNASKGYYDITVASKLVVDHQLPDHLQLANDSELLSRLGNSSNLSISNNTLMNTKPVLVDLGGIAKGFAVDSAIRMIPKSIQFTINAGGDMAMSHWQQASVSLKYAKRPSALKKVSMLASSVATSADYNQENNKENTQGVNSHIINPRQSDDVNRQIANHFKGCVSVFADTTMLADALTKVVVLLKPKAAKTILEQFNAKAVLLNRFGFKRQINT